MPNPRIKYLSFFLFGIREGLIVHLRLCLGVWRGGEGKERLLDEEKYIGKLRNLSHFLKKYFFREW